MRRVEQVVTKQDILDKYDQIEIFAKFLNLDIEIIKEAIQYNSKIHSPLRTDSHPSVGFKFNNRGKLRMKDFAGYFWGDVFDLVAFISNKDINTKAGFKDVLTIIVAVFKSTSTTNIRNRLTYIRKRRTIITVSVRDWTSDDYTYWNRLHTGLNYITRHHVFPIQNYWIHPASQPEPKYYYNPSDPAYGYYIGKDKDNIDIYQIYFPYRTRGMYKPRFIMNSSVVMGMLTLRKSDTIVVTKSYKDVIALHIVSDYIKENSTSFLTTGSDNVLTAISLPSETHGYTSALHNNLISNYKYSYTLLDYDRTGVSMANYIRKLYKVTPTFLTNGKGNTIDYKAKDISEYLESNGKHKTAELIINTLNILKCTQEVKN